MNPLFLLVPITLPLLGGLVMLVRPIKKTMPRRIWCEAVACATSVCVWISLLFVRRDPVTVYSFIRGFAVNFRVDGMAALFALMISVMWPLVLLYAFEYMHGDEGRNQFFAFFIMTYGVTLGVCFSSDMITMYLFFEMLTLVTIPLVSHYGNHESMYAGRLYAAYTIGGASLGFMAVVLTTVYGKAGMFLYGGSIDGTYDDRMLYLAFILAFIGFGAKAAVFPLHNWLPMASVAPTPVTALLHAVAVVNSGVFAVMRITYYVFGEAFLKGTAAQAVCLALAIFSLLFGAAQAIRERHFKRRLAYSTMSNLSYMLLGAMTMTPLGLTAGLAHMLFHGIIKITLFSKWTLLNSCMQAAAESTAAGASGILTGLLYGGVVALIVAAFLCAIYTLTISVRAFFTTGEKDHYAKSGVREAGILMLFPILFFTVFNIVFGVYSGPVLAVLTAIGEGRL